jgi:hypothetical protein
MFAVKKHGWGKERATVTVRLIGRVFGRGGCGKGGGSAPTAGVFNVLGH